MHEKAKCWCFVEQTKPQQYRKSTKSMKCTTSEGTGEVTTQHCDTVLKHICTQEKGTVLFGAFWNRLTHSNLNEKARCWCFYVLCWTNETTITRKKHKTARKARGGGRDWGGVPVNLHRPYVTSTIIDCPVETRYHLQQYAVYAPVCPPPPPLCFAA